MAHITVLSSNFHSFVHSLAHSFNIFCAQAALWWRTLHLLLGSSLSSYYRVGSKLLCEISDMFIFLSAWNSSLHHFQGERERERERERGRESQSFLQSDHQSCLTIEVRHMEIQQAAKQAGAEIAGSSFRQSRAGGRVFIIPAPLPAAIL